MIYDRLNYIYEKYDKKYVIYESRNICYLIISNNYRIY